MHSLDTFDLKRTRRARLLTWLALRVTGGRRSCPSWLAERIANADFENAVREGAERQRLRLRLALDWPGPPGVN